VKKKKKRKNSRIPRTGIRLGRLNLGKVPCIAVPFRDRTPPAAIRKAKREGAGIAELRIDLFSSAAPAHVLREIRKFHAFPTIATLRSRREGGSWRGGEKERLSLFRAVLPRVDAVDIELSSGTILKEVAGAAHKAKKTVIISFHDFRKTPSAPRLAAVLRQAKSRGADIVKIAAFARSADDVKRLADFTLANRSKNLIVIAMGKKGTVSRILFPALGSLVTFAHGGQRTAPGQLSCRALAGLLKQLHRRVIPVKK